MTGGYPGAFVVPTWMFAGVAAVVAATVSVTVFVVGLVSDRELEELRSRIANYANCVNEDAREMREFSRKLGQLVGGQSVMDVLVAFESHDLEPDAIAEYGKRMVNRAVERAYLDLQVVEENKNQPGALVNTREMHEAGLDGIEVLWRGLGVDPEACQVLLAGDGAAGGGWGEGGG